MHWHQSRALRQRRRKRGERARALEGHTPTRIAPRANRRLPRTRAHAPPLRRAKPCGGAVASIVAPFPSVAPTSTAAPTSTVAPTSSVAAAFAKAFARAPPDRSEARLHGVGEFRVHAKAHAQAAVVDPSAQFLAC